MKSGSRGDGCKYTSRPNGELARSFKSLFQTRILRYLRAFRIIAHQRRWLREVGLAFISRCKRKCIQHTYVLTLNLRCKCFKSVFLAGCSACYGCSILAKTILLSRCCHLVFLILKTGSRSTWKKLLVNKPAKPSPGPFLPLSITPWPPSCVA